jgi:hypothetical protein
VHLGECMRSGPSVSRHRRFKQRKFHC